MLAFDLETTGVSLQLDRITCAAVYDPDARLERVFFFDASTASSLPAGPDDPEDFMALLDGADRLCSFNGAGFDLPFIQAKLGASEERVRGWRLKLHDVFVACKWGLGVTFSLGLLLERNGIAEGKTGSGREAVALFYEGKLDALGAYCLQDTRVTHRVSSLQTIHVPRTKGIALDPSSVFKALDFR